MTEENETLDFHEFVLKLPDSAWNLSSESLEHAAQLAREGAMSGLSPWQAASLYSKLTGKKTLATVKDTMALVRDALLTLKGRRHWQNRHVVASRRRLLGMRNFERSQGPRWPRVGQGVHVRVAR